MCLNHLKGSDFRLMNGRVFQHVLFWGIYFLICLYNELYLSQSFSLHPSAVLFFQTVLAVVLLLGIKIAAVYFIFLKLIPDWIEDKSGKKFFISVMLTLLLGALFMRLMIHGIVWPYVYGEPRKPIHFLGLLARYFYSLLDLVQIVGIAISIKFYKLKVESIKKEKNLILEKSKAEVLHLKAQTNPHFLFNTLNSIYSLARSKSEQTADVVMRLSKLLRYTLYDTDKRTVSVGEELNILRNYIELQQLRFSNRVIVDFVANIDSESTQIAPLLLLPIIENAYKHCDESNVRIMFDLNLVKNKMNLSTSNPVSFEGDVAKGSGLSNLRRQLHLLYRDYILEYYIENKLFVLKLSINLDSYAGNELFDPGR